MPVRTNFVGRYLPLYLYARKFASLSIIARPSGFTDTKQALKDKTLRQAGYPESQA
jgi:hypothetical protein